MPYTPINDEILARLTVIAGSKNVLTDNDAMQPYSHDEVTDPA